MPKKYHLETEPMPARFVSPGRVALLDWEEGCLKCARCVKLRCVYNVYRQRRIDAESLLDTADSLCKRCFQCVQNCPNRLISQAINPEYKRMGNQYWTPDILTQIAYQAETGRIPVSGAGYGGPFSGPGFDAMWTDMSEIVRPTRDGIHGREYISTLVDLGRKPEFLKIVDDALTLESFEQTCFVESPVPFVLAAPAGRRINRNLIAALAESARRMEALAVVPADDYLRFAPEYQSHLIPHMTPRTDLAAFAGCRLAWIDNFPGITDWLAALKKVTPKTVAAVRLSFAPGFKERTEALARAGADIIHLFAQDDGRQPGIDDPAVEPPFIKELVREVHLHLVDHGLRDEVTILAGGGLALAEHIAKTIVCGADAAVVDLALWASLECRICGDCLTREVCPVDIEEAPMAYAVQRIVNLCGAWRNQLLEVLGAMGLREIRRLRGEVGRAMFFEQLEAESFAPIFGRRKNSRA